MKSARYACKPNLRDYWSKRAYRALQACPEAQEMWVGMDLLRKPYSEPGSRVGCGCQGCYQVGIYMAQVMAVTLYKLGIKMSIYKEESYE